MTESYVTLTDAFAEIVILRSRYIIVRARKSVPKDLPRSEKSIMTPRMYVMLIALI